VRHLELRDYVLDAQLVFGHVALMFATAHAQGPRALILKHCSLEARANSDAQRDLAREDWQHYLALVTGMLGDDRSATLEFFRQTGTQDDWLTLVDGIGVSQIDEFLAGLKVPTLLLHQRGYTGLREEEAIKLATRIADARLVLTEGSSLIMDAGQGLQAVDAFLKEVPVRAEAPSASQEDTGLLSARETDVLRLLAQGKSNPEIAKELFITRSTVQNHVSSILIKTNLQNRAQAAVYARDHGLA
jgi:DNA-binding CsgD family transcriptional regulator